MAKRKRATKVARHQLSKSPYFMQPGKRGSVVVLHRACGNRVVPKVCGTMPSRAHAKMLITQLEKAESVVSDLFLEATDDGIEALEAVLSACREEVMKRGPRAQDPSAGGGSGAPGGGGQGSRHGRGRRGRHAGGRPTHDGTPNVTPLPVEQREPEADDSTGSPYTGGAPYNEAAS